MQREGADETERRRKKKRGKNDRGQVAGCRWGSEQVVRGGRGGRRRRRNEALALLPQ